MTDNRLEAPAIRPSSRKWILLMIAIAAQVVIAVDFSLASIAIPSIEHGLNLSPAVSQWVLTAYLIAYAGFLIVGGRLADAYGQRLTLAIGLGLFLTGSAVTGLANDTPLLFGARVLQGLGGAMVYPSAFSFISVTFPAGVERFKAFTINMACQAVGVPLLTIVGGTIITTVGWRGSFMLNIPLSAIIIISTVTLIPARRSTGDEESRIPFGNAIILTSAMFTLVYALTSFVAKDPQHRLLGPYALVLALGILLAFTFAERRSANPLIPQVLLRMGNFRAGVCLVATMALVGKGIVVLSNISFQKALGFSPFHASLALLPMAVASLLLIPANRFIGRAILPVPRLTLISAFATLGLLYLLLAATPLSGAMAMLLIVLFLAPFASVTGVNMALSESVSGVSQAQQGVATAIIYTAVQMVSALGMAVIIAASGRSNAVDPFARFSQSFMIGAAICASGVLIALVGLRKRPSAEAAAV